MRRISAYVPVRNGARTLARALESIRAQTIPVDELLVIEDGSTDESAQIARRYNARLVRFEETRGRGAARARAFEEARHEFVFGLDATNIVQPDFLERILIWFDDPAVAGVFGRITQLPGGNAVSRWRSRHLYREGGTTEIRHHAMLACGGAVLRKSSVLLAGGFSPQMKSGEDADLGRRLLAAGMDIVFDPQAPVVSIAPCELFGTLERYWRWGHQGKPAFNLHQYLRQIWYSLRVMAPQDLESNDRSAALISLLWPHFGCWMDLRAWLQRK